LVSEPQRDYLTTNRDAPINAFWILQAKLMKRFLPKSEFRRNVLTLFVGTIIAQAIPIAVTPILTRLYSPEEFGLFALYMGLASILSVFVTGRYDLAVMLPKNEDDAANLVCLSLIITVTISILLLLIILIVKNSIAISLQKPELENWLPLIPATVFLTGIYQILNSWNNRKKRYMLLAKNRIFQSTSMSVVQLSGGLVFGSGVFLVIGDLLGKIISASSLYIKTFETDSSTFQKATKEKMCAMASRYKKFPIFDIGSGLANTAAYQMQNILFPFTYGLSSAGLYFLVLRVLVAPMSVISAALTDVYKQKLTDTETTDQDLKKYFKKMFIMLSCSGLPFLIIFMFLGESLFAIIFGPEWQVAGEYAIILAPMFYIRFIASPLSYFLYLKEKQQIDLRAQLALVISVLASLLCTNEIRYTLITISILFSAVYLFYIFYSAKLAGIFAE
jgi:O-antigen/teichoic acid export membrane protein